MPRPVLNKPPLQCEFCSKAFKFPSKLKRHLSDAHDVGVIMCKCTKCNFETKQKDVLTRHVKEVHGEVGYCCPVCYEGREDEGEGGEGGIRVIEGHTGVKGVYKQKKVLVAHLASKVGVGGVG